MNALDTVQLSAVFETTSDVRSVCVAAGIDLRGGEGQPFCCGERMEVRSGILGPDYAKCHTCETELRNLASPHVNGGYMPNPEAPEFKAGRTWMAWTRRKGVDDRA